MFFLQNLYDIVPGLDRFGVCALQLADLRDADGAVCVTGLFLQAEGFPVQLCRLGKASGVCEAVRGAGVCQPVIGMTPAHRIPGRARVLMLSLLPQDSSCVGGGAHVAQPIAHLREQLFRLFEKMVGQKLIQKTEASPDVAGMFLQKTAVIENPLCVVGKIPVEQGAVLRHPQKAVIPFVVRVEPERFPGVVCGLFTVSAGHVAVELREQREVL